MEVASGYSHARLNPLVQYKPRRSCRDSYQPASGDRLLRELTTEHGIHDECLRWPFEFVDVASQVLERLSAKPRGRSESGYRK